MGKGRKEEAAVAKVKAVYRHDLLDAARKAAAALESVSNEFGVKVTGDLNIVPFEDQDVHRSAHGHVRNETESEPQYNVSVDYNASA